MPRLVTKFKYLKPGQNGKSVGGYARYIATREGVEKVDDTHRHAPATKKQQALIEKILRDFPETRGSQEYEDFQREQTVGNASEFISMAIEENLDAVANTKTYADYIATRPRAERFGSHGLFTDDGVQVQLSKVSQELNAYKGNVYTAILSLKREDAARLGFDNGTRWRDFLRGQTQNLSENLKIPMEHLRWYAAFHNEGHHPHIHLIAYSTVPGEGHLSKQGMENMRSAFAREIFSQELLFTYQQQTEYRDRLRERGRESISEIVEQINSGTYENPRIEELLLQLSDRLSRTTGKKVYGYLKPDVKAIVDQIIAELAGDENIRKSQRTSPALPTLSAPLWPSFRGCFRSRTSGGRRISASRLTASSAARSMRKSRLWASGIDGVSKSTCLSTGAHGGLRLFERVQLGTNIPSAVHDTDYRDSLCGCIGNVENQIVVNGHNPQSTAVPRFFQIGRIPVWHLIQTENFLFQPLQLPRSRGRREQFVGDILVDFPKICLSTGGDLNCINHTPYSLRISSKTLFALLVLPKTMSAYPFSSSSFSCSGLSVLTSTGRETGSFTSKGSPL